MLSRAAQRGHMEVGVTLAVLIVILSMLFLSGQSEEGLWARWLSWPWWGKAGSVLGAAAILILGWVFEQSRRWPRETPRPPPSSKTPDE